MANPVIVNVPADTWHKVATNVTLGQVQILGPVDKQWYFTYRDTGDPAPTTEEPEVKLDFQNTPIENLVAIDVYLYHRETAGRVRVDL